MGGSSGSPAVVTCEPSPSAKMAFAMIDLSPPPEPPPGTPRRWFLAGGAAVLLGGGAGVAVELSGRSSPAGPTAAPAALIAAVRAERALIADLDATTGGSGPVRSVIRQARADHAAHLS